MEYRNNKIGRFVLSAFATGALAALGTGCQALGYKWEGGGDHGRYLVKIKDEPKKEAPAVPSPATPGSVEGSPAAPTRHVSNPERLREYQRELRNLQLNKEVMEPADYNSEFRQIRARYADVEAELNPSTAPAQKEEPKKETPEDSAFNARELEYLTAIRKLRLNESVMDPTDYQAEVGRLKTQYADVERVYQARRDIANVMRPGTQLSVPSKGQDINQLLPPGPGPKKEDNCLHWYDFLDPNHDIMFLFDYSVGLVDIARDGDRTHLSDAHRKQPWSYRVVEGAVTVRGGTEVLVRTNKISENDALPKFFNVSDHESPKVPAPTQPGPTDNAPEGLNQPGGVVNPTPDPGTSPFTNGGGSGSSSP